MFLKSLSIRGFKSFPDRTELVFEPGVTIVVGPNGSGKCIRGDSLVQLNDGRLVPIQELVETAIESSPMVEESADGWTAYLAPGELKVLSMDQATMKIETRSVAAAVKRKSPSELVRIKTRTGREIVATAYHPVFTLEDGVLRTLRADELVPGRRIALPRFLPLGDLSDALPSDEILAAFREGDVYAPNTKELKSWVQDAVLRLGGLSSAAKMADASYMRLKGASSNDSVDVASLHKLSRVAMRTLPINRLRSKTGGEARLPASLTPDLARFLGYCISEGRSTTSNQIWFVNSDPSIVSDFCFAAKATFGVESVIRRYKESAFDVLIFSSTVARILDRVFEFKVGSRSAEKRVPPQIFHASDDVVKSFLSSLFEGDGSIDAKRPSVEYVSLSKELVEGVATLLTRFGVVARVSSGMKRATNSPTAEPVRAWRLTVFGTVQVKATCRLLKFVGAKKSHLESVASLPLANNPNLDILPGATSLVRDLVSATGVKVKGLRSGYPTLAAYTEQRCQATRPGLGRTLDAISIHGLFDPDSAQAFEQLETLGRSDVYWDEITEVERQPGGEWVYDLCVPVTQNFIANGIVVHNSNIVDAISWVLGEQGPRSLRGGKMEDVIFAGSRLRPALGMAEVSLTIDNSAGLLPIAFTEVTITRSLFRSGESEYRLNGQTCRLLDVQEVLSDTGVGREQHTIIGQGQLDAVLTADPIQMRGFIEEAAGVGKHRRRKERALRKIAGTEQNLVRLSDLLAEIRRQLRPLREQAEVAKRHLQVADEFGRVRLVIAARDLAQARLGLGDTAADLDAVIRIQETELSTIERQLIEAESHRQEVSARAEREREAAWALARSQERLSALGKLAAERARTLEAELGSSTEADAQAQVRELKRRAADLDTQLAKATDAEGAAQATRTQAEADLSMQRAARTDCEERLAVIRTTHRESAAEAVRIRGEIAAAGASKEVAVGEQLRFVERTKRLADTHAQAERELVAARSAAAESEAEASPLEIEMQQAEVLVAELETRRSEVQVELRTAERESAILNARASVRGGAASPQAAQRIVSAGIEGVVGTLANLVETPGQYEPILEALFGNPAGVVVVSDRKSAIRVLENLKSDEPVDVIVAEAAGDCPEADALSKHVKLAGPRGEDPLAGIFIARNSGEAANLASKYRDLTFVTLDGVVARGPRVSRGAMDVAAAASQARDAVGRIEAEASRVEKERASAQVRRDTASHALNELDASMTAIAERIAGQERELHATAREIAAIEDAAGRASAALVLASTKLDDLALRLPPINAGLQKASEDLERLQTEHHRATAAHGATAESFEQARVHSGVAAGRKLMIEQESNEVSQALESATATASNFAGFHESMLAQAEKVASIANRAHDFSGLVGAWASEAEDRYVGSRGSLEEIDHRISELRTDRATRAVAVDDLRVKAREEDLTHSEMRIRARVLEERMREEWQCDPDETAAKYGHRWEVEDESRLTEPLDRLAVADDESLRRKYVRLERDLAQMGTVNPLAASEFQSLTEREDFLAQQIADVRASRRDLFKVVASVDDKIRDIFESAFNDVAREYEHLFAMLFPGGQGRLRLTDPKDLLASGVEVEARPGGKNLKRLSLLSGGERALSALAVLFAIFGARPSPFYILDEVEAALDDVNLHRFLGLLGRFRESSQLLVVTHQKRTMEAADVLYGVSIKPDGASRVISERLTVSSPDVESLRGRLTSQS